MERFNCFATFRIGEGLAWFIAHLRDREGTPVSEFSDHLFGIQGTLREFIESPAIPGGTGKDAAGAMLSQVDWLLSQSAETAITAEMIAALNNSANGLRSVVGFEFPRLNVFSVQQRRAWSTDTLMASAELAFSDRARWFIANNAVALADTREAGRCLLFGLWTAVGFHIFRALETMVLEYFPALALEMPPVENRSLGNYLNLVEKNGADGDLIRDLRGAKNKYRNPLMHPEETLDQAQAENLFNLAEQLADRIAADVLRLRTARATASMGEAPVF